MSGWVGGWVGGSVGGWVGETTQATAGRIVKITFHIPRSRLHANPDRSGPSPPPLRHPASRAPAAPYTAGSVSGAESQSPTEGSWSALRYRVSPEALRVR